MKSIFTYYINVNMYLMQSLSSLKGKTEPQLLLVWESNFTHIQIIYLLKRCLIETQDMQRLERK